MVTVVGLPEQSILGKLRMRSYQLARYEVFGFTSQADIKLSSNSIRLCITISVSNN